MDPDLPTLRPLLDELDRQRFNTNMDDHYRRYLDEQHAAIGDERWAAAARRAIWGRQEQV